MDDSMKNLNLKDRLIIANQLKILEKLYPEEADYYSTQRKAIEKGYKLHYSGLTEWFYDEMSEDECREVLNILEMYRSITFSYRKIQNKEGLEETKIKFCGFDGNEESNLYPYPLSRQKTCEFKMDSPPAVTAVGTEGARRATGVPTATP